MAYKSKKEAVEAWSNKTKEQLMDMLWKATREQIETRNYCRNNFDQYWAEMNSLRVKVRSYDRLRKSYDRMAEVLDSNGLKPIPLRVYYTVCRQDGKFDAECCGDCTYCGDRRAIVKSICFYEYSISDGILEGLKGNKEEDRLCNVVKVVDDRTGEVIYEEDEEDE